MAAAPLVAAAAFLTLGNGEAQPTGERVRVATYNIEWFGEEANPARVANLKSVIKSIDANVVGMQEIASKKALTQVFDDEWQLGIKDDPADYQEPAIAVKKPLVLESYGLVFPGPALDYAFPNARDVLRAVVATPSGQRFTCYVVHLKSRRGGRANTDPQREMATGLIAAYIAGRPEERYALVMGDMNDAPDDRSVNILETGDLLASGGRPERRAKTLMVNPMEPLYDQDAVTYGVNDRFNGTELEARVEGAKAENEKFRGQNPNYPADYRVTQTLLDQILVTPGLAQRMVGGATIYGGIDALRGRGGRTTLVDGKPDYVEKGDLASDHLPVVVEFSL